ncbi:MAG: pyruvate kinase [Candidatus Acidulodesulfobacterium acidiphilum]|uniref:Pyruvate kinase n=1 Tax=Candidatus Acidulodesulfobacterium acidiphilum TaxID=2597224 RepID=A0A520XAF3_9DELT|nr:MAG: pyruvate kinase [Candidatus Acidulodesulfobacterium acidiphilum]
MINIYGKKVKIVATLGPASDGKKMIEKLIKNGADVIRLNFSHGDENYFAEAIKKIRSVSENTAILIDLPGPKIRTGKLNKDSINLQKGNAIILTNKYTVSDERKIYIDYPYLCDDIKPKNLVYIDDGKIKLKIVKKLNLNELEAEILTKGVLKAEKGINFPDSKLSIPSVTENDKKFLKFGAEYGADMFAISFVRSSEDITSVKKLLKDEYPSKKFLIVAKIEKMEAVKNIDKIAAAADALMVARGDLGVEAPIENIPIEQKRIIYVANLYKKPVITATQMLLSMVENETPTRAEVTDISNAIFDGTDAVMLSEETAIGKYPDETVAYMSKIIKATEKSRMFSGGGYSGYKSRASYLRHDGGIGIGYLERRSIECDDKVKIKKNADDISDIIAETASTASGLLDNCIIAAITRSGYTANLISSFKPPVPIVAVVPDDSAKRRLSLNYGVSCITMKNITDKNIDLQDVIDLIKNEIKKSGHKCPDYAVITGGVPIGEPGSTDFVKIVKLCAD